MSVVAGRLNLVRKTKLGHINEYARRKELKWPHQMQLEMLESLSPHQI
ncbi:MAG: hypothetical protein RIS01_635 [Actinomycetota bacterium]